MSIKQDCSPVRTVMDLERKYKFGKQFAEVMGIALDAQQKVEKFEAALGDKMNELDEKMKALEHTLNSIKSYS